MLTTKLACEMARELSGVTEQDHFGSDAFRTPGGIFATVWHQTNTVNLRLTVEQQLKTAWENSANKPARRATKKAAAVTTSKNAKKKTSKGG